MGVLCGPRISYTLTYPPIVWEKISRNLGTPIEIGLKGPSPNPFLPESHR